MCPSKPTEPRQRHRYLYTTTALFCFLAASSAGALAGTRDTVADDSAADTVASTAPAPAATATASSSGQADVYPVDFFAQYSPQNAFDMVARLPGFSFDRGSNQRGFGGNAGNVLIDGARPTSKSTGLEGLLKRIPAAQVERIEITRGGVGAGDAAGQSTVANVIRKKTGSSGTWTYKTRRAPDGRLRPNIEAAFSSKIGSWDTTFDIDIGSTAGNRTALITDRDADGTLTSSDNEVRPDGSRFLFLTGEGSRPLAGGKLSLNGRAGGFRFQGNPTRFGFEGRLPDGGQPDTIRTTIDRFDNDQAEFGADWAKTFENKWKLRLIGLAVYEDETFENPFRLEDFVNDTVDESLFIQDTLETEFIARSTFGKTGASKLKPEFGIEIARNKLDTSIVFTDNGVDVQLDNGNIIVSELRGEAFANFVYQATPKLTLDGGLTFEISEIKVSGDSAEARTLQFLKPRISATYNFSKKIQLTLEAERSIGQLNFSSFAASTQTDDDRTTAGNPDLEPDKQTAVEATFDWKFSERGSLKVNAFHQWRSDILEQIILPSGGQGRGNAGNARVYGYSADLNLPLDVFLKGALLEVNYRRNYSRFRDEIIDFRVRNINNFSPRSLNIEFRHDLIKAKVSYGIFYNDSFVFTNFQVDEIQPFVGNGRFGGFIETTRFFGVKMRFQVDNLNTGEFTRTRQIFEGTRNGAFSRSQVSARLRRPAFRFDISGTF